MIKIEQLKFGYSKKKILFNHLNAEMSVGKVYGLLGHNGAGKTTMLKLIAGLLFPKSGKCSVMDFIPKERNPYFLQEIFYVPEEFDFPSISIDKFIKAYSVFYPQYSKEIMDEILVEFELQTDEKLNALSFGQKKKFLLAFALSTNCKLLLLDEPTNGLDIPSKSKFRKIIARYINDDRSFVISTHQVRDLDNILDSVIIIEKGEVVFDKTIDEIQSKLIFRKVQHLDDNLEVLYSDKELGGYNIVTKNTDAEETKIDLEMLYNAINANKEHVNNAFN
ncbi:MAG: ABC transporter ATP-binding protein [Bacteroidetes bacterium GWF2_33_16]|nr:MAG: ABC transporter ATP-binding protein [Bacteroidetes bacterium GWE2_32_14]OFY05566.1 MAG: ABC transporter ATP-binding protein [Bacteroidetes bacterium GWF2_33_16]